MNLRGYLCHCVSYMPEVAVYLEGTDADICKMLVQGMVNNLSCDRIPLSDMRAMRYDQQPSGREDHEPARSRGI